MDFKDENFVVINPDQSVLKEAFVALTMHAQEHNCSEQSSIDEKHEAKSNQKVQPN